MHFQVKKQKAYLLLLYLNLKFLYEAYHQERFDYWKDLIEILNAYGG